MKPRKLFDQEMDIIRQGYKHFDSRKTSKYIGKTECELLTYIRKESRIDWTIILINFRYESYVWRFYPVLKKNLNIALVSRDLELTKNNGVPKNILFIVYLINKITCFNARVRFYFYVLHWNQKIFLFYNRYYRYLGNEKKFGKRNIIPKKYNHKVHFIPYLYRRELTGVRIEKNHLHF